MPLETLLALLAGKFEARMPEAAGADALTDPVA